MRMRVAVLAVAIIIATANTSFAASLDDCLKSDAYNSQVATYNVCTEILHAGGFSDSDRAKALTHRANALHFSNRPALAIEDATAAIELDPNLIEAYLRRAWAYWAIGDYASGTRDARSALALNPESADAWVAVGVITFDPIANLKTGNSQRLIAALERAIEYDPEHPLALYNLAVTLIDHLGKVNEGLAAFDKLFAADRKRVESTTYHRDPGWKSYPNFFVQALETRGRIKNDLERADALSDFDEVIRLAPDYGLAYIHRSHYFLAVANDPVKALTDARKAQELEPSREEPIISILRALGRLKRFDEQLPLAQRLIDRPATIEGRARGYLSRYSYYESQGRFDEAFADGQQWLTYAPQYVPTMKTRLERRGYYSGPHDLKVTEEFLNGFKACVIDPEC